LRRKIRRRMNEYDLSLKLASATSLAGLVWISFSVLASLFFSSTCYYHYLFSSVNVLKQSLEKANENL